MRQVNTYYVIALLIVSVISGATAVGAGVAWYGELIGYVLPLVAVVIFFICVLLWVVIIVQKPRGKKTSDYEVTLLAEVKKQHKALMAKAKRLNKYVSNVPIYIFLEPAYDEKSNATTELGYFEFGSTIAHDGIAITTIASQTSVAYKIKIPHDCDFSMLLVELVFKQLKRDRGWLPINAIYTLFPLANIFYHTHDEITLASRYNQFISQANNFFNIDLPIHVKFSGLEQFPDLATAALLQGYLNGDEAYFGYFLDKASNNLDTLVDDAFEDITQSFDRCINDHIKQIPRQDVCAAFIKAPFHLSLLKVKARAILTSLSSPLPPSTSHNNIQTFSFIGSMSWEASKTLQYDPISSIIQEGYYGRSQPPRLLKHHIQSVTEKNASALSRLFHKEAFIGNPNKVYIARRKVTTWCLGILLSCLSLVYLILIIGNYIGYHNQNDKIEAVFHNYYHNTAPIDHSPDLVIDFLSYLVNVREALTEYNTFDQAERHWYLPDWSVYDFYHRLYEKELRFSLRSMLKNYLSRDGFVYSSINVNLELIRVTLVEKRFHEAPLLHKKTITDYFLSALLEERYISSEALDQYKYIIEDLLNFNITDQQTTRWQQNIVAEKISTAEVASLIYKGLINRPQHQSKIDVIDLIGARFFEVFKSTKDNINGIFIPIAFTRDGFETLFASGDMSEAITFVEDYEELLGEVGKANRNEIIKLILQQYTDDYIETWNNVINNLHIRTAKDWEDIEVLLEALARRSANPILSMYQTLDYNLNIPLDQVNYEAAIEGASEVAGKLGIKASVDAKASKDVKDKHKRFVRNDKSYVAESIRRPFAHYFNDVKSEEENSFHVLIDYFQKINVWLNEARNETTSLGLFLFQESKMEKRKTPIKSLEIFALNTNLDIIKRFGNKTIDAVNHFATNEILEFLNTKWQDNITNTFQDGFNHSFPFKSDSETDFPLNQFATLFALDGKVQKFLGQYIQPLSESTVSHNEILSFNGHDKIELTPEAQRFFQISRGISSKLFHEGKPAFKFSIRVGNFDPAFSRLRLSSGLDIYTYSHGPSIWKHQTWPHFGPLGSDIKLRIYKYSVPILETLYIGDWSWFRLFKSELLSYDAITDTYQVTFQRNNGLATLEIQDENKNAFNVMDIYDIHMPTVIFDTLKTD